VRWNYLITLTFLNLFAENHDDDVDDDDDDDDDDDENSLYSR
jgi:hypothetical protein